jgi:transcriptional regulator GlxA family with amidase domain
MVANDNIRATYDMKLAILTLDSVFDTGLVVLMDTFSAANELAKAQGSRGTPFDVTLIGPSRSIRTGLGLTVRVEPTSTVRKPDWLVVPALNAKRPDQLLRALQRSDVLQAVAEIREWHRRGISVAGACVGTFLLAEAGLLDGHEATTTWSLAPLFRQLSPNVQLDDRRMIAASQRIVTAGAALGHMDLAFWLLSQKSPELAALVARFMLLDRRPSQAKYIVPAVVAHADPLIERFERWARDHLADGFSLMGAAEALSVTPRTLQRRTESVLGKSPLAFFQDLRIERARHLISTGLSLDYIASQVGYADTATLRNLLRRRLGRGVRELRQEA